MTSATLLNLITGELKPKLGGGEVQTTSSLKLGKFSQHFCDALPMGDTPVEHLLRKYELEKGLKYQSAREALGKFGLGSHAHEIPIRDLSGGQKARVLLADLSGLRQHYLNTTQSIKHLWMRHPPITILVKETKAEFGALHQGAHPQNSLQA